MSDSNKVAEAIRLAYFESQGQEPQTAYKDLSPHRKNKWLLMADAAIKAVTK